MLLALLALIAGIFFAGRAQGLFEPTFRLEAVFTAEEGSYGLKKGSEVKITDTLAGRVTALDPTEEGLLRAEFELKESFHRFVRTSSTAVVRKTLVVAGDSYVDITVGNRADPLMPSGSRIPCTPDTDLARQAALMLDDLRGRLLPTVDKVNALLDELAPLAAQARLTLQAGDAALRREVPPLALQAQDTLRAVRVLVEGLQRHWLVRKYIEPPDQNPLIDPADLPWPASPAPESAP